MASGTVFAISSTFSADAAAVPEAGASSVRARARCSLAHPDSSECAGRSKHRCDAPEFRSTVLTSS